MTDLQAQLDVLQAPREMYALGVDRNEAYCIVLEGAAWRVFCSERGNRNDELTFMSEATACADLLARVLRDGSWQAR